MVNELAFALHCRLGVVLPNGNHRIVQFFHATGRKVERPDRGQAETLAWLIATFFLCPIKAIGVVATIGSHTSRTNVFRIGITREHVITIGTHDIAAPVTIASILHVRTIFPTTLKVVVIILRNPWIAIILV